MNYYRIAPLNRNLAALFYQSSKDLKIGQIAQIKIRKKDLLGVVIEKVDSKPDFATLEADGCDLFFNENQVALANFISYYYCVNLGIAYGIFTPSPRFCEAQNSESSSDSNKNFCEAQNSESSVQIESGADFQSQCATLTQKQSQALDFIRTHAQTLLFGDTGSGKTEIYIHAMIDALKNGQNVIFLLPEISLTPQMEARMRHVFGELVCVWHSKISKAKKSALLAKIHDFRIIMGARSALFLPIKNLGLIIVDEEHDDSYKSSAAPMINARDCSIVLAAKRGIKLVLGSATPSVVSYYNFSKNGNLFRLKGQHFAGKKDFIFESSRDISENIFCALENTLRQNKQSIVFVPIRANFKTLVCENCGSSIMCKNCAISLSLHSKKNALMCHYCGWSVAFSDVCPHCKSKSLRAFKMGTQEAAKEIQNALPDARIAIFDRDEITSDAKLRKILNDFNNKKIDILVGTQMISKGHDYHSISSAVVLGIDNLLLANDFRAHERAVSLLFQISGRCARKDDGRIIIQTKNREFFCRFLKDYEDFLVYELENRKDLYPPFCRLALVCVQHKNDEVAKQEIESCKKIVESERKIEIVGANRAPIERLNGKWRHFMLLRAKSPTALVSCLHRLKSRDVAIDIDPLHLT